MKREYMELKSNINYPLVSVVISTYNSASTIEPVLEALLKQDYPLKCIEIIVVDGASIDNTVEIVKKFAEKYGHLFHDFKIIVHERNMGVSKARNDGIKVSKGEFILILDSDVVLPPHVLREMIEYMMLDSKIGFCKPNLLSDIPNFIMRWLHEIHKGKIRKTLSCADAALIRREVIERAGLYDETLGPPFSVDEDLEYGARIWRAGYKCLIYGRLTAMHLAAARDRHLTEVRGLDPKKAETKLTTLFKWFISYMERRQALSWWKVLSSMPLQMKVKFYIQSFFIPSLTLFMLSLAFKQAFMATFWGIISLFLFLSVFIEFFDYKNLHKALLIALLASFNRSIRTLSAVLHRFMIAIKEK